MSIENRKNISREEKREYTIFETMQGLDFDYIPNNEDEGILIDSRPFEDGGIQYYILRKN